MIETTTAVEIIVALLLVWLAGFSIGMGCAFLIKLVRE
jgi:hypothetical protein